jgi:hypothetical protein
MGISDDLWRAFQCLNQGFTIIATQVYKSLKLKQVHMVGSENLGHYCTSPANSSPFHFICGYGSQRCQVPDRSLVALTAINRQWLQTQITIHAPPPWPLTTTILFRIGSLVGNVLVILGFLGSGIEPPIFRAAWPQTSRPSTPLMLLCPSIGDISHSGSLNHKRPTLQRCTLRFVSALYWRRPSQPGMSPAASVSHSGWLYGAAPPWTADYPGPPPGHAWCTACAHMA